ncbi:lysophospholipid acyltransferase family protein [Kordiimonas aquimaris]|uniref:lysophospholipid acyltransferase family protein n=1 Tax=Kordiimonas aquimaris TaxID=707591 RepID=UPI0021D31071|nr:lysophospholipid acyltransferase family protein [Kordiimonas aquimaris]
MKKISDPNTDASSPVEYGGLKSNLRAEGWSALGIGRVAAIMTASVPLISVQYVMARFSKRFWWPIAGLWHRTMCRILGIDVRLVGAPATDGVTLYAANHISWLDIIVLGGQLKNASFIAKSEVAGWGLLGTLCGLHKTVFVNRARRTDSARQRDELAGRIAEGHSLILFPEGTNTSGIDVAPFKSALFSVAERADEVSEAPFKIQPITVAYIEVNDMPLVRSQKPWVAWLGDVELFSHLRQFTGRAKTAVTIEFHEPVTLSEAGSRKELAQYCEARVKEGLERAHRAELRFGPRELLRSAPSPEAG